MRAWALACAAAVTTYTSLSAADLSPGERARRDAVIAEVGSRKVTVGELEDRLATMPDFQRETYGKSDDEVRKNVLSQVLVREALLAQQAEKSAADPLLRYELGRARSNATLREVAKTIPDPSTLAEADVAAYYEAHKSDYQAPLRIHVWRILLGSAAEAEALLTEFKASGTPDTWSKLCREKSLDEATKLRKGTLGFLSPDGTSSVNGVQVPKEHYEAVRTLSDGEFLPTPIAEGDKFAVLWRRGSTPAKTQTLAMANQEIRRLLFDTRFREAREKLVADLRARHVRDVDTTLLGTFSVDVGTGVISVHQRGQEKP